MPQRPSKSEIDRLGDRLRDADVSGDDDMRALQRWRALHDAPMAEVEDVLRHELGLRPTSRLKTETTIVDKLRRETIRLSQMQDIAGLRVVEDVNLEEQDELTRRIQQVLPRSRLIDRRERPSYGYRAVHVVVRVDGFNVEIQVRTDLQDLWAQLLERLADVVGRGIRYGEMPVAAKLATAVQAVFALSETIRETELGRLGIAQAARARAEARAQFEDMLTSVRERAQAKQAGTPAALRAAAEMELREARQWEGLLREEDEAWTKTQADFDETLRGIREGLSVLVAVIEESAG